jgi:methyltransferase (TIGR00027 family)
MIFTTAMEDNRHSATAAQVAAVRAYHSAEPEPHIFDDPIARRLLSGTECQLLEKMCMEGLRQLYPKLAASCPDGPAFVSCMMRVGGTGAIVLSRARYIEDSLLNALAHGVGQYVIIGAGLDTYCFRQHDPGGRLQVIEIDHPSTQEVKRKRLESAGLVPPAHLHFASADLERESLSAALGRSPFDPSMPAFFAWPGVTMYLTREAVFATLRSIGTIAASGSELVFDYLDVGAFGPAAPNRVRRMVQRVRDLGEPFVSSFNPETLSSELSSVGLRLLENLDPLQIQTRFLSEAHGFEAMEHWHLARTATHQQ